MITRYAHPPLTEMVDAIIFMKKIHLISDPVNPSPSYHRISTPPRSTAVFFENLRDGTSSSSFHTPFIPKDVEPGSIIPDRTVKRLVLMLIQDFVPIFSLDCLNVTTFPLPSMDEAKLQAGVNLQAFTEELNKYPSQLFLASWWLPSLGQYLPPEQGSAVIEAIS